MLSKLQKLLWCYHIHGKMSKRKAIFLASVAFFSILASLLLTSHIYFPREKKKRKNSNNLLDNLYSLDEEDAFLKSTKHGNVYYSIFAGRKQFMKIHFYFTEILLSRKLVDEVHIWDFCADKEDDRAFLMNFLDSKENSSYVLFKIPETDKFKYGITSRGAGYLWESYYDHYAVNARYKNHDILVKADDDIVWMDVNEFGDYVDAVRSNHFYFPNIVNNDAGLYVQAVRKADSSVLKYYKEYQNRGINFAEKFNTYFDKNITKVHTLKARHICPLSSPKCNMTLDDWEGGIFMRGDIADDIHEGFLANREPFIKAMRSQSYPRMIALKQRISINMFAANFFVIRKAFSAFLDHQCCDDEGYMGKWPSLSHKDHLIDSHFTIVHFAFNMQYAADPKNLTRFIEKYEHLASSIFNRELMKTNKL